jgi:RNA polymerase sigma-70 factor (ECF subfamily)
VLKGVSDVSEAAFRDHYRRIYRFARRRSETHEQAEDVAQSVFAAAAEHLGRVRPEAPPTLAWLYTVAERRLIDEARRRERRGSALPLTEAAASTEFGRDVSAALRSALGALPASQREVVVLRLLEGRSFAEVAARVGTSEAAAKMRFARALDSVREALRREGIEP